MNAERQERRTAVLTDDDISRLVLAVGKADEKRRKEEQQQLESIGYDLSTPQTRAEIHADHAFIRGLRKGTGRFKMAALGAITVAILGIVGHWLVIGVITAIQGAIAVKSP